MCPWLGLLNECKVRILLTCFTYALDGVESQLSVIVKLSSNCKNSTIKNYCKAAAVTSVCLKTP